MIEVLKAGLYSSIQDMGRFGSQQFGVPISGVMDSTSASLANKLLGNDNNDAVLEITMQGPKLKFTCTTAIAICGADMSPKINGDTIQNNELITIDKNAILEFGKLNFGYRCYLAVKGGFLTPEVLGSRSMSAGVTNKQRISKGDVLPISIQTKPTDFEFNSTAKSLNFHTKYIEVFKGPEYHLLDDRAQNQLLENEFTISNVNNRMAYQLEELVSNNLEGIITSNVIPGTVQLTPFGRLIILMRDCQTTGGYARIFQLSEASTDLLSQKHFKQKMMFRPIDF